MSCVFQAATVSYCSCVIFILKGCAHKALLNAAQSSTCVFLTAVLFVHKSKCELNTPGAEKGEIPNTYNRII